MTAIQEMERVCTPGGRILLLEHGLSGTRPIARFQEWRAGTRYRKAGRRRNQEPLDLVKVAGLKVKRSQSALLGMITMIVARADSA